MTDRERFYYDMARENVPTDIIDGTLRHANTLQRLAVKACNEELSDTDRKREENAEAWIAGKLAAYEIRADFSGDPRGAVVKLRLPSGRGNSFGDPMDYCVPTNRY